MSGIEFVIPQGDQVTVIGDVQDSALVAAFDGAADIPWLISFGQVLEMPITYIMSTIKDAQKEGPNRWEELVGPKGRN